jgi:Amino acid permease.
LALFSVGYVAMSKHIVNAGAMYAFVTRGLGRHAGVAAALIALVAYNALQLGLVRHEALCVSGWGERTHLRTVAAVR